MRQEPKRTRQKRCLCCGELFTADPRSKGKQRYCSKTVCQTKRQRLNEAEWRRRNPDCLEEQYERTRLWNKSHPDYSRQRRRDNPKLAETNRSQTRLRMRRIREKEMFDKSKSILTQLAGNNKDKYYLTRGYKWLLVRLTKASLLSKAGIIWDNRKTFKQVNNCLPKGQLYDMSGIF